ncbi:MAG: FecR family protein [Cyclobacteriaceae bacterium]
MNEEFENSDLLIKWLNNELNAEELDQLKKDPRFPQYQKILNEIETWSLPKLNTDQSYERLVSSRPKAKVVTWYQTAAFRVAATITIILGSIVYILSNSGVTTISTGLAETREVVLPDSSKVFLASSSSITFDKNDWDSKRNLEMTGSVFFDVKKEGNPFEVAFESGIVKVLGTSFEIKSLENFASVMCYSGRVSVESHVATATLMKGKGVRIEDSGYSLFEFENHTWQQAVTRLHQAKLSVVFRLLESHFKIKIDSGNVDLNRTFTGAFPNNDINAALDVISNSMGLTYQRVENAVTFSEK